MEKEKKIETEKFLIQGNILIWESNMIQLSNISYVSTSNLKTLPFPTQSLIIALAGLILLFMIPPAGIVAILVFVAWIFSWYKQNQERSRNINLNILLNSGHAIRMVFRNKEFLQQVLKVLMVIFADGNTHNKNVSINIKNCTIEENANVLNDLDMNI